LKSFSFAATPQGLTNEQEWLLLLPYGIAGTDLGFLFIETNSELSFPQPTEGRG
jgi:hypothetical protein